MLNAMKQLRTTSCLALFLVLAVTACQPSPPQGGLEPQVDDSESAAPVESSSDGQPDEPLEPQVEFDIDEAIADFTPEPDFLDPAFVKERYALYHEKQAKWQQLKKETALLGVGFEQPDRFISCYQLVNSLALGYHDLENDPQHGYFSTSKYDIRFLSEDCDTVFGVQAIYLPTMLGNFKVEAVEKAGDIVLHYAEKQDYQRVVAAVENMPSEATLSSELNSIYGRALIKMGRLDDAARVLSLVVEGLDPREQWPLRLEIAELRIASGEYEKARNQYLAIAEVLSSWEETHKVVTDQLALLYATDDHTTEIALYTQCLHAYLSFDGHSIPVELEQNLQHLQTKYPNGIHADAAMRLYIRAEEQVRNDLSLRLLHVQKLAEENRFQQALDVLQEMKQVNLPDDAVARIDEMVIVISEGRDAYIQLEKEKRAQALADRWQEGINLLDMQMYDEAIGIFSELLGTEYDAKAVKKIEKGAALAAVSLRKEAANLFVRARRTKDYNSRISLLNQSRTLLQEILDKYPQVDLAEKVAVNIEVIDEQLQGMGVAEE